jgi:DNA-binding transcriptional ArsR family regulator
MLKHAVKPKLDALHEQEQVIESAAELFGVLSAPLRLKILKSMRDGEKNVSELLSEVKTTQPNMSQHLNTLYKANILGKRRNGVNIYYRITDSRVIDLCRLVCPLDQ